MTYVKRHRFDTGPTIRREHLCRRLVGVAEIAERMDMQRGSVVMWTKRYREFPRPVARLKMGPIYDWHDVVAWLVETGRRR